MGRSCSSVTYFFSILLPVALPVSTQGFLSPGIGSRTSFGVTDSYTGTRGNSNTGRGRGGLLLLIPELSIPQPIRQPLSLASRPTGIRIPFALGMSASSGAGTTGSNDVFDLPEDGMITGNSGSASYTTGSPIGSFTGSEPSTIEPRYLQGDKLQLLRQRVLNMRQSLHEARESGRSHSVQKLSHSILAAQQMDGEFMYQVSLERLEAASQAGWTSEAEQHRRAAAEARASLPQFQLDGLWVGKYGDTFQMINVSYCGDVLTAHKVTGDGHVPKGKISFQVDLSPSRDYLEPIELSNDAMEQWGSKYLQRHAGIGQVAADGFINNQWLDGQLILVNHYFSFAWLPTGHQVFFGRPNAELTLKMLRRSGEGYATTQDGKRSGTAQISDDTNPRLYLERCMEETELLDDDMEVSDGIFRSHDQQYYFDQSGCFQ